ncbi:MAG: glycosyltransferase family 4 protein [Candidatus Krumholzibacteria bacterium]|nr:glycosyltransferase family 4 protein [Candidatus Krumholzibacteria bacterium]
MKIGIVTQSYYPKPGGVTEVVHHTAAALRRLGHDVTVITTRYGGADRDEPGIVRIGRNILVPANGAWTNVTVGAGLRGKLEEIFRRERFDVIQTHCPLVPTLPLLTIAADRAGAKLVGTFHAAAESNALYGIFRAPLERRAARLDCRIAVSRPAAEFAARYFPGEYEIIPNGIDCSRFSPDVTPIEGLRDGRLNILFVGRMDRRKGLPYLFRALPLIQRSIPRLVRLVLVGEGTLRRRMIPRPLSLGGAEIMAAGRVDARLLPRYYAAADLLCAPATGRESFGIVLLEAMASRRPVVATDIPGFRGVVTHGREGLLVEPRSPGAIAEAVVRIASSPALSARLGEAGRSTAMKYAWDLAAVRLEDCFLRLLERPRKDRTARVPVTAG